MHKDFDETYRQMRAQQQADLDTTDVWNRIEDSLDLEQLWPRIDISLTRYRRRKIAVLTLVSFFIPAVAYLFYLALWNNPKLTLADQAQLTHTKHSEIFQVGNETTVPKNNLTSNIEALPNSNRKNGSQSGSSNGAYNNLHKDNSQAQGSFVLELANKSVQKNESSPDVELPAKQQPLRMAPDSTFALIIPVRPYYLESPRAAVSLAVGNDADTNVRSNAKRFYLSFTSGVKTTWLLNNHTYKSLQKESFEYLQRQYYPVASVGFGMSLNSNCSVEGNLVLLDFGGQHVNYLDEGKSIQLQTRLRYATLELIGGYQLKKVFHPFRLNVYPTAYLGVYSSALLQSKIITNEINADRNKSFRDGDFGLLCRIGFTIPVGEKLQVQAGLGVQSGIVNISHTQASIPAYFDRTFNASGTAFLSAKYFLK